MEYVIGIILAIIVIIIVGLLLRKRLYDSVDYYESWILDIMNRNVAQELSKVKELNLEGDTKENFEEWKEQWDYILTVDLAKVEELLYDTEHAADRYNFPVAKKYMKQIEETLVTVEKKIETILIELNELLATEQENRKEIEELEPLYSELRKELTHNRFKFAQAEVRFEVELDEINKQLKNYESQIEEGNYIQAKEIVSTIKKRLVELQLEMEEFPDLYKTCKQELPSQLDELSKGLREMKDEGYYIDHLDLTREINVYQSRLLDTVSALEKEGIGTAKSIIEEVGERITEMYELLEKEALAKNYVDSKMPSYEKALDSFETHFLETKLEVEQLKEAYYFEDTDLEKYMALEKMMTQLKNKLMEFAQKIEKNNHAHSKLRAELDEGFQQLDKIEEEHEQFKKRIQNLRKDEFDAREQLKAMMDEIYQTTRKLRKSNLPGVPSFVWSMIEEAGLKNERVLQALDNQPLDIIQVQQSLSEAKVAVENAIEQTNAMLEQAALTEQVIQYANRYRSTDPVLAAKLSEAETLFRKAEYELSLEQAASAIEDVEPGALKKIEKFQEMIVS
ncbi:septation ring formation regulator EzrA [Pseudogracilibacillus sp. SO30301A]|uniref:septation ring formation regulator EzrA n=1 Tax=Pseudogracilibacillus sp. SO30301A TaxID=3098291 RepID=UPI00300E6D36